ncbi:hypothetical protein H0H93_009778 [Arthromyces matolae]|nr:hypothetical protein H0H93_009778 [Arthromyces matolae]
MPMSSDSVTGDLDIFPTECIVEILQCLPVGDLVAFAGTCETFRLLVRNHIKSKISLLLKRFSLDDFFLELLDTFGGVISGSAALWVINPWTFNPGDLDIYMSWHTCDGFVQTLIDHYGMTIVPTPPTQKYDEPPGQISTIYSLRHGSHKIEIMESRNSSLMPIFSFHSTVVMNCVTSTSIFCAFPYLTSSYRNLASYAFHPIVEKTISRRQTQLTKYEARGYDGRWDLDDWDDIRNSPPLMEANHQFKWRTARDRHCLWFDYVPIDPSTAYRGPMRPWISTPSIPLLFADFHDTQPRMPSNEYTMRRTRSGKPFSPIEISSISPSFDFCTALRSSNCEASIAEPDDLALLSRLPDADAVKFWREYNSENAVAGLSQKSDPLSSPNIPVSSSVDENSDYHTVDASRLFTNHDDGMPSQSIHLDGQLTNLSADSISSCPIGDESLKRKKKNKRVHDKRRKRLDDQAEKCGRHPPGPTAVNNHLKVASPISTNFGSNDFPVTRGGFTALPAQANEQGWGFESLQDALDAGYQLIEWDGKTSKPFLSEDGRVFLVLVGMPDDPTYLESCRLAYKAMGEEGSRAEFVGKDKDHKRGPFPAKNVGVTMGLGATYPTNLQCGNHKDMLDRLLANEHIARLASFADGAFNLWAPNLHKHYRDHLFPLFKKLSYLRPIFPRSIWTAAAFNFPPNVFTKTHRDSMNLPGGWCAIQSLGAFDPTKGGHIFFPQLKLVVEFPPGSLVLIPSATIIHANIPVQKGDRRASFTQYSAGGLFRYVENGYCTEAELRRTNKKEYERICALKETRWKLDYERFSLLSDLATRV